MTQTKTKYKDKTDTMTMTALHRHYLQYDSKEHCWQQWQRPVTEAENGSQHHHQPTLIVIKSQGHDSSDRGHTDPTEKREYNNHQAESLYRRSPELCMTPQMGSHAPCSKGRVIINNHPSSWSLTIYMYATHDSSGGVTHHLLRRRGRDTPGWPTFSDLRWIPPLWKNKRIKDEEKKSCIFCWESKAEKNQKFKRSAISEDRHM